jgi:hypothetical protein
MMEGCSKSGPPSGFIHRMSIPILSEVIFWDSYRPGHAFSLHQMESPEIQ